MERLDPSSSTFSFRLSSTFYPPVLVSWVREVRKIACWMGAKRGQQPQVVSIANPEQVVFRDTLLT